MRRWNLDPDSPLSLVLASDVRLSQPDYLNDHIWELSLGWGSPPGLVVETTYGLRANSLKIFPSFVWRGEEVTEIKRFHRAPEVQLILPNYSRLDFAPFKGILVQSEYWVPGSHCLAGKMKVSASHSGTSQFRLRVHASLIPREPGQVFGEDTQEGVRILSGRTEDLFPVLFVTGGARVEATHAPALAIDRPLHGDQEFVVHWAICSEADTRASFLKARETLRMQWEEQTARIERVNSSIVEFFTGDDDWDASLHFAQTTALSAFTQHEGWLPHPSIVAARDIDSGCSANGSGRDHWEGWSGQKSTHTAFVIQQILPIAPDLAKGLLRNLIHVQDSAGQIDGRPGLAGQRLGSNAVPLLAHSAWRIFSIDRDVEFLQEVYQRLGQFVESWGSQESDYDQDGAAEWKNTLQADFGDWPTFARWHDWGENFDIRFAETAMLVSYLLSENRALSRMANVLDLPQDAEKWSARSDELYRLLRDWPKSQNRFLPRERDTHATYSGKPIATLSGAGKTSVKANLIGPARLVVRIAAEEQKAKEIEVSLLGRGDKGRFLSERIAGKDFEWYWQIGSYTTREVFHSIESVQISNAPANSRAQVFVPDLQGHDLTQLLPIWALRGVEELDFDLPLGLLKKEGFYWHARGIATVPAGDPLSDLKDHADLVGVRMDWNAMLAEALIELGEGQAAGELIARLLNTASQSLREDHAWRERYHPDRRGGAGRRHSIIGAAPVGLFMKAIGLRLHSPWEIDILGPLLFEREVTIRWRGLEVRRNSKYTEVTFPNGYIVVSPGSQPRRIYQDRPG